jgi:beta-glucanase (GH16 family)
MLGLVLAGASMAHAQWGDEFNGSGAADSAIWGYDVGGGGWGNNELQTYTSGTSNAWQEAGYLRIQAKNAGGYTSARLKTQGKRTFQMPATVDVRLRGPMGQGLWPAVWSLGSNFQSGLAPGPAPSWPGCGEIDIMEHINNGGNTFGTIHWWNQGINAYAYYTAAQPGVSFTSWNTYGIEWVSNLNDPVYPGSPGIIWRLNGGQVGTAAVGGVNGTDEFSSGKPYFVIMNVAIGGNWPGNPDGGTAFPANMDVDYVRVNGGGGGPTPTTAPRATPTSGGPTPTPTTPATGDFTQGVTSLGSTQARVWFRPNGYTAGYVIIHYLIDNQNQQNLNMAYNSAAGQWEQTVTLAIGNQLTYSFTYQKAGLQYDSQWFIYVHSGGSATPTSTARPRATATATVRPRSGCTPSAITPYLQVNGGAWQQTASVTVSAGATVRFGPQPATGGSWSWSTGATTREITITANASNTYTATHTNSCGSQSSQTFTVTVTGARATPTTRPRATATATTRPRATATATVRPRSGCTPSAITPYLQVNGGAWQQTSSVTVSSGASVRFGPQPVTGGSWSWSTGATTREITITATSSNTYTATHTNACGSQSSQTFTVNITGRATPTPTTPVRATPTSGGPTPTAAPGCPTCTHKRLKIISGCAQPMWIQHLEAGGNGGSLNSPNFRLLSGTGAFVEYDIPDKGIAGVRFWPGFGCDGSGHNCTIGASGGPASLGFTCPPQGCSPPIDSKFEGTFGCIPGIPDASCQTNPSGNGAPLGRGDWWNSSFVDGYTVPMRVQVVGYCPVGPQPAPVYGPGGPQGGVVSCTVVRNSDCPTNENLSSNGQFPSLSSVSLRAMNPANGQQSGCYSPSGKLTFSNWAAYEGFTTYPPTDPHAQWYACPTPPITPEQCMAGPAASTAYTNMIHTKCQTYAYPYDDHFGLASCPASATTRYEVTFYCPS